MQEINTGKWENLPFEEIREKYPEEYEARSRELRYYAFPGGESFYQAGIRFGKCLEDIRKEIEGNLLIVTHAGVMRGYLRGLLGVSSNDVFTISQPYAGITLLSETNNKIKLEKTGWRLSELLDEKEIQYLYRKCKTPERAIRHMEAVAQFIHVLEEKIRPSNHNWELLKKSALVHDICRAQREHALAGADVLGKEGYEEIAKLVELHNIKYYFAFAKYL